MIKRKSNDELSLNDGTLEADCASIQFDPPRSSWSFKSPQPEFLHLTILIELAINRDVLNFRPPRCSVVEAQYLIKLVILV